MTSKIKVDNINKVSDDSNIINKCGATVTVGAASDGVRTGSNNLQAADGGNSISQSGTTITLGASGDTIALASGASQTGFGRTGTVDWQTGDIKTATFTAVNGQGFFCDTNSGGFTVNLPAGSAGAIVSLQDYRNTFDTANLLVTPNGTEKINGGAGTVILSTEGEGITLVYIDSTIGWRSIQDNDFAKSGSNFVVATGGTETTCGDFKIHTFTGPGTFAVSAISPSAPNNIISQVVVAGGGGASAGRPSVSHVSGGGGAGGFREESNPNDPYVPNDSPLASASTRAITAGCHSITVGAGGTGRSQPACSTQGGSGSNSIGFGSYTSAGGGGGGSPNDPQNVGLAGGSGGGGSSQSNAAGGAGNTPPVSPPQGNTGGTGRDGSAPTLASGGGGGAGAVGGPSPGSSVGGSGGAGVSTNITGSAVTRAGGGAGVSNPGSGGSGGPGGGASAPGNSGTANTGGGGAGSTSSGGSGGSGIVILRYKFQ